MGSVSNGRQLVLYPRISVRIVTLALQTKPPPSLHAEDDLLQEIIKVRVQLHRCGTALASRVVSSGEGAAVTYVYHA